MQYGLLRRYLPRMGWWVLATIGGWLLGLLLIFGWINIWTFASFDMDLAFIVLGLSIAVGQWLLLRRRLPRAGWWIGANVVGWGMAGLITGDSFGQFGLLAMGLLPACATVMMLLFLMNQAQPLKCNTSGGERPFAMDSHALYAMNFQGNHAKWHMIALRIYRPQGVGKVHTP